jgi:hypothetical protein
MDEKTLTVTEIAQALRDSEGAAGRRRALGLINDDEQKGWTAALMELSKRLTVESLYIDGEEMERRI